jgi:adenylylsulfate kinase
MENKNSQPAMAFKPAVIWLTGLSSSGKTTIAGRLAERLAETGITPILLDGDEIRTRLRLTAFDEASRIRHNLYLGYLASMLEKEGRVVVVSLISPYKKARDEVRAMCKNFIEVFVSTPLETCMQRDHKGLYNKALRGEIKDFTGISAPYEPPLHPEITIDNGLLTAENSAETVFNYYCSLPSP